MKSGEDRPITGSFRILLRDPSLSLEEVRAKFSLLSLNDRASIYRNDRRHQQLLIVRASGKRLALKRYRNARKGLERFRPLRFTSAWRSWQAAARLQAADVPTPAPRFLIAWKQGLVLACDALDARELYEILRDETWLQANWKKLAGELSRLLQKLKQARITHGDLHPRNILIDETGRAWLVDLDGVRAHRWTASFIKARRRDEHRLATQLELQPDLVREIGFYRVGERWELPN